jgi:hypothetical protein
VQAGDIDQLKDCRGAECEHKSSFSYASALLGVALPVSAVASFLGGIRKARNEYREMDLVADVEVE